VLTTPLRLATASQSPRMSLSYLSNQAPLSLQSIASPTPLPAYIQMFHENGTAKDDEDVLPPYISEEDPPAFETVEEDSTRVEGNVNDQRYSEDVPVGNVHDDAAAAADALNDSTTRGGMDMLRSDLFESQIPGSSPALPSDLLDVMGRRDDSVDPKVDEDSMDGISTEGMSNVQPPSERPPSRADTSSPDPCLRGYFNGDLHGDESVASSSTSTSTGSPLGRYRFQAASMTDPSCASTVGSPSLEQDEAGGRKRIRTPADDATTAGAPGMGFWDWRR
jgi:hypothetical protein